MKTTMTARDIVLMRLSLTVLVSIVAIRFLLIPQIGKFEEAQESLAKTQEAADMVQARINDRPVLEAEYNAWMEKVREMAEPYYGMMENRAVDELVTGLALEHRLFPVSLSIAKGAYGIPDPYLYSQGGTKGADALIVQAAEEAEKQKVNPFEAVAIRAEEAAVAAMAGVQQTEPQVTQSAFYAVETSMTLRGARSDIMALLDDIAENYPSMRVRTIQLADGTSYKGEGKEQTAVEETDLNCVIVVYMCMDWMKG